MGVRLPPEYQETEYITSALKQWIDTGYVIQNEKIQIEAKFVTGSTSGERDLIGNQDQTSNRFVFGIYVWRFFAYAKGSTSEDNVTSREYSTTRRMFNSTVLYDLDNSIKSITINGESWSAAHTVNIVSGTDTTVKVFSDGRNQGVFVCDLYSIKLIDGDNLAFDLVPCYRKADSKPGMYDLVSGTFLTNAGTGDFAVGPDVIDRISPCLVAWRRMLMRKEPELYPMGTDVVAMYAANWVDNSSWSNTGGTSGISGASRCTNFIPINPKYTYRKNGYRLYNYCCWYDKDKHFIRSFSYNNTTAQDISNIPENARYMRISTYTVNKEDLEVIRIA